MTDSNPLDAMTKSLSPTAAAVWEAFEHANCDPYLVDPREAGLAAALRAAADQVVPSGPKPSADSDSLFHLMNWTKTLDQYAQRQQTRAELLAIATELDTTND